MRYFSVAKQVFVIFWLAMFIYITTSMILNTGEVNLRMEKRLQRSLEEMDVLHSQNRELASVVDMMKQAYLNKTKLEEEADKRTTEQQHRIENSDLWKKTNMSGPSIQHELARRKLDNNVREFWLYMRSELHKLRITKGNVSELHKQVAMLLHRGAGYQITLNNDLSDLSNGVDDLEAWRFNESQKLGNLVQKRIQYLQNPKSCADAKKMLCKMSKQCGYGCQLHHVTYCMIMAYATERTLILESEGWRYAQKGWETLFLPLSRTCTTLDGETNKVPWGALGRNSDIKVVEMPIIDSMKPRPDALPLAVPDDIADRLIRFHGNPAAWWIGQIIQYLTRPQPYLKQAFSDVKSSLGFKHPIVGVQVRRTDKITAREAQSHPVKEYMTFVEEWFNTYEQKHPGVERLVYIATDDSTVLKEAEAGYPNYKFLSVDDISKSAALTSRYTETSARGVVTDIHILSECDFLVCTFSSQVCRVAYEIMQTIRGDASGWFKSLDDMYYFGGQNAHHVIAVEDHRKANGSLEIDLKVDDIIKIAGNHWDGYSKGTSYRTGKTGLFPSYKVREKIVRVKMPTYPAANHIKLDTNS